MIANRLLFRVMFAVVGPLLAVWVFTLWISDKRGRERVYSAEISSLEELSKSQQAHLAEVLSQPQALTMQAQALDRWAYKFAESCQASGVFLLDGKGQTLAARTSGLLPSSLLAEDREAFQACLKGQAQFSTQKGSQERFLMHAMALSDAKGKFMAVLEIDRDEARAELQVRQYVKQMALLVAALILMETLVAVAAIYMFVLHPLLSFKKLMLDAVVGQGTSLGRRAHLGGSIEMRELGEAYNVLMERVSELVKAIKGHGESLADRAKGLKTAVAESNAASREIASAVQQIAQGAADQASRVSEINQLVLETQENSKQVKARAVETMSVADQANQAARTTMDLASRTENTMDHLAENIRQGANTMQELGMDSQQIGMVVDLITGIADQTNLLSLNAAIEAARAGEQGRGFSVVAAEVRKLAEQAANATAEIGDLIRKVQSETMSAVNTMEAGSRGTQESREVIGQVAKSMQEILSVVSQVEKRSRAILDLVDTQQERANRIVKSIEDIAAVSEETAASTQEASASTEQHTSSMEEMALAAESMSVLAAELNEKAARFKMD
jgi:methyl-accepting chemotaxis protein